jgi:quinolinate synthase
MTDVTVIQDRRTPIRAPIPPVIRYRDRDFTDQVEAETRPIWEKAYGLVREEDWVLKAPLIRRINQLKREKNVVILAHNYQSPEIYLGVADFVGDSLELARRAAELRPEEAPIVMMCGVHFMAETVKILAPDRKVLLADLKAGCSLAESITGADIRLLRQKYPGIPVVSYVNTSADVKAETDACCTSSNAVFVVEAMAKEFGTDSVIFLPDRFLAANVAARTKVKIIAWHGTCMVHDRFTPAQIHSLRAQYPGARVLAHPECPPEVCAEADYVGSTSGMIADAKSSGASRIVMVTECEMADNVASSVTNVEFVRPCVLCPHMQRITLPKILASLETLTPEVIVPPELIAPARRSVEKMLAISKGIKPQLWAKV